MRPLNLTISAFGPYADKTIISMDDLGSQGLYLITGDTGAGKTTIFDAISFALFGEASGENREASMLRSKYAEPDVPTYVELTFLHAGKEYTIKRNPEYMRPAKRGDKLTKESADAEMTMPDGQIITKKEVDNTVKNLLGINKEQFSQIAMIAQGDFLKLLLADTKERQTIFRELFKTGFYQKLQYELEDKRKEIYGQVCDGKKSIDLYVAGIEADEDDVLSIEVSKAKKGQMTVADILELLDKLVKQDAEKKKKLDSDLKRINKELEEVNGNIGIAEALENTKNELGKTQELLNAELSNDDAYKNAFEDAKANLQKKDELLEASIKIERELPEYELLDSTFADIETLNNNVNLKQNQIQSEKTKVSEDKRKLEELRAEQAKLNNAGELLQKLKNDSEKVSLMLESVNELEGDLKEYDTKVIKLSQARKDYLADDEEYRQLNLIFETKDRLFRDAQAGILALNLREGEKCPVCGSVTHPELAKMHEDAPTEKELNDAKKKSDAARDKATKSANVAAALAQALEIKKTDFLKKLNKVFETAEADMEDTTDISDMLQNKRKAINAELETIKANILEEEKREARKHKLQDIIPDMEKKQEDSSLRLLELEKEMSTLKASLDEKTNQCTIISQRLSFKNKKEAENKIGLLKAEANKLQQEYQTADNNNKEHELKLAELNAKLASYKLAVSETKEIDLISEKDKKEKLDEEQRNNIKISRVVTSRSKSNGDIRENITKQSEKVVEIEKKLEWVQTLSYTANGKLAGKEKIMLETYIQTTYFDHIINRANLRFMQMSGGQYELMRLTQSENNKSQSGLELGVIDHYNGTNRSVKTLSGGESFMAALSLALGLSEEVQSAAGGIQIDTMFVDEGFGSLDPDALTLAFKALTGLTEGNRLVGIISHVAELKEKIDKQIVVTKRKSGGSYINVIK